MSDAILNSREVYLVDAFSDLSTAKSEIHCQSRGKLIQELGALLLKLLQRPPELELVLSVLCDLADDSDETKVAEQIFISHGFLKAMMSLISQYELEKSCELHRSFHICLYLLLGVICDRRHFQRFVKFTAEDGVFEDVIAVMPTLVATEIQYATQEMLLEFLCRLYMAYGKRDTHKAQTLLRKMPKTIAREIASGGAQSVFSSMRAILSTVNADNPNLSSFVVDRFTVADEHVPAETTCYLDMGVEVYSLVFDTSVFSFKYSEIQQIQFSRGNLTVEISLAPVHSSSDGSRWDITIVSKSGKDFVRIKEILAAKTTGLVHSSGGKTSVAMVAVPSPYNQPHSTSQPQESPPADCTSPEPDVCPLRDSKLDSGVISETSSLFSTPRLNDTPPDTPTLPCLLHQNSSPNLPVTTKPKAKPYGRRASCGNAPAPERSPEGTISFLVAELSRLQSDRARKHLMKQKMQVTRGTCDAYASYFSQLVEYCNDKESLVETDLRGMLARYSEDVFKTCEDIESLCNSAGAEIVNLEKLVSAAHKELGPLRENTAQIRQRGPAARRGEQFTAFVENLMRGKCVDIRCRMQSEQRGQDISGKI